MGSRIPWFSRKGEQLRMKNVDEKILFLLGESELELTANNIARNLDYSSEYMRQRLKNLTEEGLVGRSSGGGDPFYWITEEGVDYLEDEIPEEP